MVQYKDEGQTEGRGNYWKLWTGNGHVLRYLMGMMESYLSLDRENHGIRKVEACHLYSRMQRGLMYYGKCSTEELRRFCEQRKIEPVKGHKQRDLRIALERADDDQIFGRFEELPTEVRLQIYKQFFASFDDSRTLPQKPTQPPISRVSRRTRRESLPLFYAGMRFPFAYFVENSLPSIRTARRSQLLLHKMNANVAHVRSLELLIRLAWDPTNTYKICVDLFKEPRVVITEPATDNTSAQATRVKKEFQPILEEIMARKGAKKLKQEDLLVLVKAAAKGLQNRVVFED